MSLGFDIPKLTKIVREESKDAFQRASFRMSAFVGEQMNRNASNQLPKTSKKLDIVTGGYFKSFIPNKPNNINIINQRKNKTSWVFGTSDPRARSHEEGLFIKAKTPAKSSKGKKTKLKWRMTQFFYFKYFSTGKEYFKNVAFGVEKRGGVQMKKRPVLTPAIENFLKDSDGMELILNESVENIRKRYGF